MDKLNKKYVLKDISEQELLEFFKSERIKVSNIEEEKDNESYITYGEGIFDITNIHAVTYKDKIVAFIIIPKYSPDIALRLYVTPEHRKHGIARFLLNAFDINRLGCLKDNIVALAVYEKLGFKVTSENMRVYGLQR